MTHELIPLYDDTQRNFYQYLETRTLYINLEPSLQSIFPPQSKKLPENNEACLKLFGTESRRQGLDTTLHKLFKRDILGKAHINDYLLISAGAIVDLSRYPRDVCKISGQGLSHK